MTPFGVQGSRKLQDILVDAKVPASVRDSIPVFECGGEIVWVPGYRIAAGWAVSGGDASALQLSVEPV
jgi:tRNA(Ile)-lysidine synthase